MEDQAGFVHLDRCNVGKALNRPKMLLSLYCLLKQCGIIINVNGLMCFQFQSTAGKQAVAGKPFRNTLHGLHTGFGDPIGRRVKNG
ncbi:MAG: hypothetical protein C4576_27045 [Desulfobacteraceae bacterium]|nr:MAG: hypothetical protein C4576_27045 [Desulfobacteraceae bacterium]